MATLKARLDKQGHFAVCGLRDCGTRLFQVFQPIDEISRDRWNAAGASIFSPQDPFLMALPGWTPDSNRVWRFSQYAAARERQGRSVKLRRYPRDNGALTRSDVMDSLYELLPAQAQCRECGVINVVEPGLGRMRLVLVVPPSPAVVRP